MSEVNKAIIRRYYEDLWNHWDLAVSDEIIAVDIAFRGSIGATANGREEFKEYVKLIRSAFPDFHNTVEEMVAEEDKVVARLTYTGTHEGPLWGIPSSGRRVGYPGVAIFHVVDGMIGEAWVLGDTQALARQLGVSSFS